VPNLNLLINKKLKISLSIILFSLLVFTINHTFYQIYQLIYQNQLTNRVERNWVKLKSALTDKTFLQLVQSSDWDRLQELYEKMIMKILAFLFIVVIVLFTGLQIIF